VDMYDPRPKRASAWDLLGEIYTEDTTLYRMRCEEILRARREKRAFQGARHPDLLDFWF
jgi:hypothetical protein